MRITELEYSVLTAIINNEFQTGGPVTECPVWTYSVAYDCEERFNISGKKFSGIVSSLSKKELIFIQHNGTGSGATIDDEDTLCITQKGCRSQKTASPCGA
jgi:hypothetical protein